MLEKGQFHNMSSSKSFESKKLLYVLYKDSFHAFLQVRPHLFWAN